MLSVNTFKVMKNNDNLILKRGGVGKDLKCGIFIICLTIDCINEVLSFVFYSTSEISV